MSVEFNVFMLRCITGKKKKTNNKLFQILIYMKT